MSCVGTDMYNIICQKEATVQDLVKTLILKINNKSFFLNRYELK